MEACAMLPVHGSCGSQADRRMSFCLCLIKVKPIGTKVKKLYMPDKKTSLFYSVEFWQHSRYLWHVMLTVCYVWLFIEW